MNGVEVRGPCPYCEHRFAIDARDIRGSNHVLTCADPKCGELFVVVVRVHVEHEVHALASVDAEAVLQRLAPSPPPKPARVAPRKREVVGRYGNGSHR